MKSPLLSEIRELFKMKAAKGDVGVEVEIEGKIAFDSQRSRYWQNIEDHSLRNGREFILRSPIPIADIGAAVTELSEALEGSVLEPSLRTSTHIHVNVQKLTAMEVHKVILAWWYIEDILVHMNGQQREGNLHCLRLTDSDTQFYELYTNLVGGSLFGLQGSNNYRYAALNLASVVSLGSLEFRFIKLWTEFTEITVWAQALYTFVHQATSMSIAEIIDLRKQEPMTAIRKLLGPVMSKRIAALDPAFVREKFLKHGFYQARFATRLREAENEPVFTVSVDEELFEDNEDIHGHVPLPTEFADVDVEVSREVTKFTKKTGKTKVQSWIVEDPPMPLDPEDLVFMDELDPEPEPDDDF